MSVSRYNSSEFNNIKRALLDRLDMHIAAQKARLEILNQFHLQVDSIQPGNDELLMRYHENIMDLIDSDNKKGVK